MPKILNFVKIIHYYSKLFTGVLIGAGVGIVGTGVGLGVGITVGAVVGAGVIVGSGVGAGASVAAATKRTRKSRMLLNAIASSQQNLKHGSVESQQALWKAGPLKNQALLAFWAVFPSPEVRS